MGLATLAKVGVHLLKIGIKSTKSKVTGKRYQLSPNERKAKELGKKAQKILGIKKKGKKRKK